MSPKPVYNELMALIKGQWWTRADETTDARGKVKVRAFYGTHRVTVQLPDGQTASREVRWERGKKNQFEFNI